MRVPASTYRLQVRAGFDLDAAADVTGYLHTLGADWAYLSPILQAATGSDHGYDVVDPTRVDDSRGGPEALARFSAAARSHGLGVLVDIVPNHQGVADPAQNPWWWDVLRHGAASAHAAAFDIDWEYGEGRVRLPVLGRPVAEAIAEGEITVDAAADRLRYYDLALPLAPGSLDGVETDDVETVLARQHFELVFWRDDVLLNYRRFFTVTSLAGVRVELPEVFDATHAEILRWLREGLVDGLRIDHPDGLADPGAYLARLADATASAYTVVEKILEHGEALPGWWATDGTTGYDALGEIERVLIDPVGVEALAESESWSELIAATKRDVADTSQAAEVSRLARCLPASDLDPAVARDAIAALLAAFPVYRAYLPAGAELLDAAVRDAAARRPDLADTIAIVAAHVAEAGTEFSTRFMQTTGPVTAKGVEDRAFYRYTRLTSLTEVGGDPSHPALDVAGFHAALTARQAAWPRALTALTTHDTKRSEDTRARIDVLAEVPERWREVLAELRGHASCGDAVFDDLLWQAIVGAWPASPERLHAYAEKAAREAGVHTSWTDPDEAFEARVAGVVDAAHGAARPVLEAFVAEIRAAGRSNALAAKLLQLAGPGVPDVYQGTELWDHSLVDPDNRRPVDFRERRDLLERIDGGWMPPVDDTGAAKLLIVSRTLRLRRDRPDLFTRYTPMTLAGAASDHAVAFDRGGALAVATRLPVCLAAHGWGDTVLLRHDGPTVDAFTGRRFTGGEVPLAELLADYPVALLVADRP
ncbi:malto-oligosyltrehalose synthase [Microbacterium telephonicum]|uniref:Maltooligosyl trehalose synthase n=1 Tax=Microbacterium telephonicum TaxID=1714841 RepID=A0A498BZB9_9MICO|nr:malto-oligosyltrehalose synthase [Microbacterium telephonicum]RLK48099.1 maltooligosyl trehalose synthase [Microbacterium telephonicum]